VIHRPTDTENVIHRTLKRTRGQSQNAILRQTGDEHVIGYVNGNLNGLVFAIRVTRMSRVTYGACTVSNGVMLSAAANTPSGAVMLLGRYLRQRYQEVA
jgi:glyceraldehyde-3-phosphate dehydrogenase/erythrose-4-phosphate dehydrogenase